MVSRIPSAPPPDPGSPPVPPPPLPHLVPELLALVQVQLPCVRERLAIHFRRRTGRRLLRGRAPRAPKDERTADRGHAAQDHDPPHLTNLLRRRSRDVESERQV